MLKHVEKLSKQWHLIDIPDTGQTAQTEAPICGGLKSRRLCGPFFNQEHPQHQSQHTNTIKSIRYQKLTNTPSYNYKYNLKLKSSTIIPFRWTDLDLFRLEQGALSSEVTNSPIFIVGMVSLRLDPKYDTKKMTSFFIITESIRFQKAIIKLPPWRFFSSLWSSSLLLWASTSDTKRSKWKPLAWKFKSVLPSRLDTLFKLSFHGL